MTEDEIGWHYRLSGHELEQSLGDVEGQETCHTAVHGVKKSRTRLGDRTKTTTRFRRKFCPGCFWVSVQFSCSVVSDSLRPHVLYSPWNSPGQDTGVGSLSHLQGIFPTRDQTQVSRIAGGFFTS